MLFLYSSIQCVFVLLVELTLACYAGILQSYVTELGLKHIEGIWAVNSYYFVDTTLRK